MSKDKITKSKTTALLKGKFLEAYKISAFNISQACRQIGIDRSTYYKWLVKDEDFATAIKDKREELTDFVESKLIEKISNGDTVSILFYLKCHAKKRGYVEKTEHVVDTHVGVYKAVFGKTIEGPIPERDNN
jgi:hypothetical protein